MKKLILLLVILYACIDEFVFAGVRTAVSAACEKDAKIELKASEYWHPLDMVSGGSFGYGLFFERAGKSEIPLYDNEFKPKDSARGYAKWYAVFAFDGKTFIGPLTTNEFAPLPLKENSPTVKIFEIPQRTFPRTVMGKEDNPPFLNIFLDPRIISQSDFNQIAKCLDSHRSEFNQALSNLFTFRFSAFYHPLRLGGVVLGGAPYGDNSYIEIIKSLLGETALQQSIPLKGKFTLYPKGTAKGRFGGYDLAISIDDTGLPHLTANGRTVTFPADGGFSKEEPAISQSKNFWYIGRSPCMKNDLPGCPGEISLLNRNLDRSVTFFAETRALNGTPGPVYATPVKK